MDLIIAVIIDWICGDPPSLPHPVKLMGRIIALEDEFVRRFGDGWLRVGGFFIVVVNISISFFVPYFILKHLRPYNVIYHIANIYIIYACTAAGCLHREAMKIFRAIAKGIEEARYKLSFIVGRETKYLDEQEIVRATVETVAENTSDGVIAPLLYAMIGGAPLAVAYKMVNTMDSMLGYMNEKYRYIGFFPAKVDDVFNFVPARLTGVLMCISGIFRFRTFNGFRIMIRDRKNHKSPNCAYPEGACAGLLGIQLGGDNIYFGQIVKKPRIGDSIRELERDDIRRAIEIMYRAEIFIVAIYAFIGVIL